MQAAEAGKRCLNHQPAPDFLRFFQLLASAAQNLLFIFSF